MTVCSLLYGSVTSTSADHRAVNMSRISRLIVLFTHGEKPTVGIRRRLIGSQMLQRDSLKYMDPDPTLYT